MKRLLSAVAVSVVLAAGAAQAQNRDLRVIAPPAITVAFSPDDFSRVDVGDVLIGKYQTYYYAGFELGLKAIVPKDGSEATYLLAVVAPRLKAPGRILSAAVRDDGPLEEFNQISTGTNCGSYSCRNTAIAGYVLSETALRRLREGRAVDVRVTTTCGTECDVLMPIPPEQFAVLEEWVSARPSQQDRAQPVGE